MFLRCQVRMCRITPAYAGNTELDLKEQLDAKDHPRLRGEHDFNNLDIINRMGSPPPTRGTHAIMGLFNSDKGITPAYAGNTHTAYI